MKTQLRLIRDRLGLDQAAMAAALGIKQGTWSKYERKKLGFPLEIAKRLIKVALGHRLLIDLNHVFDDVPLPPPATEKPAAPPEPAPKPAARRPGRPVVYSGS